MVGAATLLVEAVVDGVTEAGGFKVEVTCRVVDDVICGEVDVICDEAAGGDSESGGSREFVVSAVGVTTIPGVVTVVMVLAGR